MKNRIDKELVNRNLVPSRAKAQELIESGCIKCNSNIIKKCNFNVDENDDIEILQNDKLKYVSRGGLKLEKAIEYFKIDFTNLNVMDIGSSTGGFCDCALKHNAKHIIAIDVGTNIMHQSLRNDQRIDLHEQTNFKNLESVYFNNIDIITCDVSFISILKIIEKVKNQNIKIDMICLIKPQFECGRDIASRYKGIILNKKIHFEIISTLIKEINKLGFFVQGFVGSPIKGGDGNIEYVSYITNKVSCNIELDINRIINEAFKNR